MPMDSWLDIVPSAVKAPYTIYKNRKVINYWVKRLQVVTNTGKTNVLVLGIPASGKSVLTSFLYGEINNLNYELPDASEGVESKAITLGEWTHLFRVIPGQGYQTRHAGLNAAFENNTSLSGVVYVVNYGYTEVRDATNRAVLISSDGVASIEDLRKYNLEVELRDFTSLVDRLIENHSLYGRPQWVFIACAKVDLFMDQMEEAQMYYSVNGNSPFSEQLKRLQNHIGISQFRVASAPISSFRKEFEWNSEVVPSSISNTETINALLKNVVENLAKLSNQ